MTNTHDLQCPHCGHQNNAVKQTRGKADEIRRERLCVCGKYFWTGEVVLSDAPPRVVVDQDDSLSAVVLKPHGSL